MILRFRCWWYNICYKHAVLKEMTWSGQYMCGECSNEFYKREEFKKLATLREAVVRKLT